MFSVNGQFKPLRDSVNAGESEPEPSPTMDA